MAQFFVQNRYLPWDKVSGATISIQSRSDQGLTLSGVTKRSGALAIKTRRVPDGDYDLSIVPKNTTVDPVGPKIADDSQPPDRIYRTFQAVVEIKNGRIIRLKTPKSCPEGDVRIISRSRVKIQLQPVWIKSPNFSKRDGDISAIIIHHTSGAKPNSTLNTFLSAKTSAHYIIAKDGQIIKMVHDDHIANHAGTSRWHEETGVNKFSIGIEIVHRKKDREYTEEQYLSLLELLKTLRLEYPKIASNMIVGHSDIAIDRKTRLLGRKSGDPGLFFDWSRLEAQGYGIKPADKEIPTETIFGEFYKHVPKGCLRKNDRDRTRRFCGRKRNQVTQNPITELQENLHHIGYAVGKIDGHFNEKTRFAVKMLQEHFFAGDRGHKRPDGRVDLKTAILIKKLIEP